MQSVSRDVIRLLSQFRVIFQITARENEMAESAGLVAVPAMSTRLARLVIAGLLLSQPNNYTDELTRPSALPGSRAIRRALEFIEGRPSEIETVADIANEVGLSVRALDDGFQRYVGTPPMSYLRHVRMSRRTTTWCPPTPS
jgi:transcriptional regulator GlxA family with amidase domain